jgi:hypothetical protein
MAGSSRANLVLTEPNLVRVRTIVKGVKNIDGTRQRPFRSNRHRPYSIPRHEYMMPRPCSPCITTAAARCARARSASTSAGAAPDASAGSIWRNARISDLGPGFEPRGRVRPPARTRPDGQLVSGARAFAALWQTLPAFRLVGRVAALPGVVHGLEWGYRGFLKVRRLWRRDAATCPLPDRRRAD